jgi:hypothetical protein
MHPLKDFSGIRAIVSLYAELGITLMSDGHATDSPSHTL